jgi:hypothetical protein
MKSDQLLSQILPILHSVKENEIKLQMILDFLLEEIYEEPDEEIQIPEKYAQLVKQVAESIDCGKICHINPKTLKIEDIPKDLIHDIYEEEEEEEEELRFGLQFNKWENCITIEPPESHESFEIMEGFVNQIPNGPLKSRALYALQNRKPFANFKTLIENSQLRASWLDFKKKKLEEYVWDNLCNEELS